MYCTGGVRCERASSLLKHELGDDVGGVFQLQGGIDKSAGALAAHARACTHVHTHTRVHTQTTHARTHTHTQTNTRTHTRRHTDTDTRCMHAHMHARTHARTHARLSGQSARTVAKRCTALRVRRGRYLKEYSDGGYWQVCY